MHYSLIQYITVQQYNTALFNTLQDSCTLQLNSVHYSTTVQSSLIHYITTVQYNIKYSTSVKESATAQYSATVQYSCFALESGRLKYPTVSTMICYRVRIGTGTKSRISTERKHSKTCSTGSICKRLPKLIYYNHKIQYAENKIIYKMTTRKIKSMITQKYVKILTWIHSSIKSKIKRTRNDTQFYKNHVVMSNQYLNTPFTDHNKQFYLYQNHWY